MFYSLCTKPISSWSVEEPSSVKKTINKTNRNNLTHLSTSQVRKSSYCLIQCFNFWSTIDVQFRSYPRFPAPRDINTEPSGKYQKCCFISSLSSPAFFGRLVFQSGEERGALTEKYELANNLLLSPIHLGGRESCGWEQSFIMPRDFLPQTVHCHDCISIHLSIRKIKSPKSVLWELSKTLQ